MIHCVRMNYALNHSYCLLSISKTATESVQCTKYIMVLIIFHVSNVSFQYPPTSIPCGEEQTFVSTQATSFQGKFPSQSEPFNRPKALEALQRTTFVSGDHRLDSFDTTTNQSHPHVPLGKSLFNPLIKEVNL